MKFGASFAPGNLFIGGEHAVVYGFPAIVASVSAGISAKAFSGGASCVFSDKYPQESDALFVPKSLLKKISKGKEISVKLSSEIPPESGMSSSTATLVAIAKAVLGEGFPEKSLLPLLLPYQKELHGGRASGAEFPSSIFGGFHFVRLSEGRLTYRKIRAKPFFAVVCDSSVRAPTKVSVGTKIPRLFEKRRGFVLEKFERIGRIVSEEKKLLEKGDLESLGVLMGENHKILKELGVSHKSLERIREISIGAGAFGSKLSGGGMGGVAFSIGKGRLVKKALLSRGFFARMLRVGFSV